MTSRSVLYKPVFTVISSHEYRTWTYARVNVGDIRLSLASLHSRRSDHCADFEWFRQITFEAGFLIAIRTIAARVFYY